MPKPSSSPIARLTGGIDKDDIECVRSAWRNALAASIFAVPDLRRHLDSDAWCAPPQGKSLRRFAVLLALAIELDTAVFDAEAARLTALPLDPQHRHVLNLLARRRRRHLVGEALPGLPVYVAEEIKRPELALRAVEAWCRKPGAAVDGVTRIDIVARRIELDYLNRYRLLRPGIVFAWPARPPLAPLRWLRRLSAEERFYSQLGHHMLGHLLHETVGRQELEADAYAEMMWHSAHPRLAWLLRAALWPTRPLLGRVQRRYEATRYGAAGEPETPK